ncbi:IPT/TIG domain-containing protein [Pontibacter populi]|uniref:IPT/TIG domain-containing protein n=1 Tax=Pontibacter populi TaxID=890055 RepID=A0ABV1RZU3_9BACT
MARFYAYPYSSPLIRTLLISFLLVFCASISAFAQTVTSFTPSSGPVGTEMTIAGSGFAEAHTVSIGSGATYDFTIVSDSEIKVKVPTSSSSGVVRVSSNQASGIGPGSYTVVNAPVITSITPSSGPVGTEVTITGSNFSATTSVAIGSGSTTNFTIGNGGTEIKVIVPASASNGSIRVSSSQGSSNNSSNYTLTNAPIISNFTPSSGPVGTEITITGSNFSTVTAISIGSGAVTNFTKVSDTELKATVPSTASTGNIRVTSNQGSAGSSSNYTLVNAPVITSFSPSSGPAGTEVVITGNNFTGANLLYIGNGQITNYSVISGTEIKLTIPPTATTGTFLVRTPNGQVNSSGQFKVTGAPVVTSFTPSSGPIGQVVTITGQGFTNTSVVFFGNSSTTTFTVVSDTQIQVAVPATASSGRIQVRNNNGTGISSTNFIVAGAPVITSFSPSSGPAGTEVILTGTNFTGASLLYLGNGQITNYTVLSDTQIKLIVPITATTGTFLVRTPNGQVNSSGQFKLTGIPIITSFSPASGPVGQLVTIIGEGFTNASVVFFGNSSTTSFNIVSDTEIRVSVPATASSGKIQVRNNNGGGSSLTNFTVTGAPTITSFSPSSGPAGTEVILTGTNFTGASLLYLGNGQITNYTVLSDTQIKLIVPITATTGTFLVRTPNGQVNSSGQFAITPPYLTTPQELTFNSKPIGGSESKEYQVSGLGLKNGEAVTLTVSESSPYTISKTPDAAGFGKTITLTGVTNNRLNPTTIFVKYTSAEAGEGFPAVIMHTQGSVTRGMDVRVVAPLPVELTSFTASLKGSVVNLQWTTASEKDNSHFEIEMSKGSLSNFRKIDIVKSKVENSSTKTQYSFSSYYSSNGETEYYRLRQVDLDGSYAYSKIVAVKPVMISKPMEVAPNPLEADSKVYFTTENNGKATIRVTSINGKQVYFEQIDVHAGENAVLLSKYNNLMAGVYIVTVEHSGKREYVRIEKR